MLIPFQQDGAALAKKLKAVYCFKLSGGPDGKTGTWYVDAKNGKGSVKFGDQGAKSIFYLRFCLHLQTALNFR